MCKDVTKSKCFKGNPEVMISKWNRSKDFTFLGLQGIKNVKGNILVLLVCLTDF
jgi:hypothetical protein